MSHIIPSGGQSPFDSIKQTDTDGEHWTGRALMPLMDYLRWEDFAVVIEKARDALELVEGFEQAAHHFGITRSDGGRWGNQKLADFRLTRLGAYLTAMAGDDTKKAVAEARVYFAVRTREAEIAVASPSGEVMPSHSQALRGWAAELEAREAAEARVAELEPAAQSWNTLATADGDFSVGDAAKILSRDPAIKLGRDRLFTVLREQGWVHRQQIDGRWRVYQTQIETGRLSELPSSHYHPRTGDLVLDAPQVRITVKGLHELHKRLGGTGQLKIGAGS